MAITLNNATLSTDAASGVITVASGTILNHNSPASVNGLVNYAPGKIINITHFQNSTRTALSTGGNYVIWSAGNVYKKIASSKLVIVGQLVFSKGASYNMGYWWQIGSSGQRLDGIMQVNHNSDANGTPAIKLGWFINGEYSTSATGNLAVNIGQAPANGSTGEWPGQVWNPGTTDDGRSQQHSSDLKIFEVTT